MIQGEIKFQIGKNGLTEGTLHSLGLAFKNRRQVRISVLKNSIRDREKIREMAAEIAEKLPGNYGYRIIGFTIVMKKKGIHIKKKAASKRHKNKQ